MNQVIETLSEPPLSTQIIGVLVVATLAMGVFMLISLADLRKREQAWKEQQKAWFAAIRKAEAEEHDRQIRTWRHKNHWQPQDVNFGLKKEIATDGK